MAEGWTAWLTSAFAVIALVFAYTLVANVIERPDGIKIASFFIAAIVIVSLISRAAPDRAAHQRCGLSTRRRSAGLPKPAPVARCVSSPTTRTSGTRGSTC